jgi:methionyl-tRNA synthetase
VIDPFQVVDLYGADALRYYAMREVRFGHDGEVSPEGFENRYTSDLANEYGNLASRTLAMIGRYRDGVVPAAEPPAELTELFDGLSERVCACLDATEPTGALEEIWQRVRALNGYVQEQQPWQLAKDDGQAERLDSVLLGLAEGLRVVSLLLWPFVPTAADRLLDALGAVDRSVEAARFGHVVGGARLGELGQLFPRVEPAAAA